MRPKLVLIVVPPLATLQDVTGPWEVFCRAEADVPGSYEVVIAATDADLQVRTKFGLPIICARSIHDVQGPIDTVLVAGSEQGVGGMDYFRLDATGRLQEMTVLWRPLPAVIAVHARLS